MFYDVPRHIGSNVFQYYNSQAPLVGRCNPLGGEGGEGYLLIRTKRVGTSDQGVVLSVFLNRVFLCTGSLKKTTCVMCDTKDIFFKEILFHDVSLKNYVIECFHSRGQHLR